MASGHGDVKLVEETTTLRHRNNESESSSGYASDENNSGRPSRDEKLASKAGLPFTARQLVDWSVEAFNEHLNNPRLTKEQVRAASCKVADPYSFDPDPAFKAEYRSGSKTTIYLSLGLHKRRPSYKRGLQLAKKNSEHFKT